MTWDVPETEPCKTCGSLVLRHYFKNGRTLRYCVNESCKTRVDHPINKELERLRARAEKKAQGGAEAKAAPKKAAAAKKKTAAKKTTVKKAAKKTTAKKK